jgi:cell division protein DivIC
MAQRKPQSNMRVLHPELMAEVQAGAQDNAKKARYYARKHKQRRLRIIYGGGLLMAFFAVQLLIGQVNLSQANRQLTRVSEQLQQQKDTHADLEQQQERLQDSDYIQQLLREKYGYTRPGETLYNLPQD